MKSAYTHFLRIIQGSCLIFLSIQISGQNNDYLANDLGAPVVVNPQENHLPCDDSAYNQAFDAANFAGGFTSDRSSGFTVADNFTLMQDLDVKSVCFWGFYSQLGVVAQPCVPVPGPGDDVFQITYYLDNAGAPGAVHAGPFPVASDREGTGVFNLFAEIFQYEVSHPPVSITAGQQYWVEVSNDVADPCLWLWTDITTAPGDGAAFQFGSGPTLVEVVFNIGGMPPLVPTMSEWAIIVLMLMLMIVGIVVLRQRSFDIVSEVGSIR